MTDDFDLDEFIAEVVPKTRAVEVCSRGDLAARKDELAEALQRALMDPQGNSLAGNADEKELSQQILDVEAEMEGHTRTFVVKALSRNAWMDLLAQHPPSKADRANGEQTNPKTFPIAAVAACSQRPEMTEDQATRLASKLPPGEWQKLWLAAVALNSVPTTSPKIEAATAILRANGLSSTTSDLEESPALSSSAGSGDPSPDTTTTTTAD